MFAGHIKVLGGPHVARGPDVAQASAIHSMLYTIKFRIKLLTHDAKAARRMLMKSNPDCKNLHKTFRLYTTTDRPS